MKSDVANFSALRIFLAFYYVSPKNNISYVEVVSEETLASAMILWRWKGQAGVGLTAQGRLLGCLSGPKVGSSSRVGIPHVSSSLYLFLFLLRTLTETNMR